MDDVLTFTEGDSDAAGSNSVPSGEVISEGPVLIGPIDLPKVDALLEGSSSDGASKTSDDQAVEVISGGPYDANAPRNGLVESPEEPKAAPTENATQSTDDVSEADEADESDLEEITTGDDDSEVSADDHQAKEVDDGDKDGAQAPSSDSANVDDDDEEDEEEPQVASTQSNAEITDTYEREGDDGDLEPDEYAEFVDNFWAPTQYTEHDDSARVVRTVSVVFGGVFAAVAGVALVLPVFGVPDGTTLAGVPVNSEEDGPKAVETLQGQLNQTSFSLTNKRGETVKKTGEELGLTIDRDRTTKGLNSWINRSGVWIQRLTGEVTLPVIINGGNAEVLTETAKAITLNIKEPEVTLTPTGVQSTPGVDGYETDQEMLVAALQDTIANVSAHQGNWMAAPVVVETQGRTLPPHISPADVEALSAEWNKVLNTPITLTKAANQPVNTPDPTTAPASSATPNAAESNSASPKAKASEKGKATPDASEKPKSEAGKAKANALAPTPLQPQGLAGISVPSFGGITLINHMVAQGDDDPVKQPTSSQSDEDKKAKTENVDDADLTPEGKDEAGSISVEEGEGESKAGEQNIQDEQTPKVKGEAGSDLSITPEDKVAITKVVQDKDAEVGKRLRLEVRTDAIPESFQNFFAAHTVTKGLKAHIAGDQDPPAKASPTDKSLHDVSQVKGQVVVDSMEDGFVPDEEATLNALLSAAKGPGGTVSLIGLEDKVSSPESLGIKEPVSTFTSFFSPGQSRVKNIHRIADLVDGVVVGPGQSFELNKHVGRRTRKNGFTDGGAIQEGQMVREVGGGVSQFATTFYNAAWFSGVLIPEHKAHSQYFSRYPAGREATLNYPGVNLKIVNDTPYAILIDTSHTSSSVTVTFWSTKYWDVESERGKCLCVSHAAFPVTWTRTRTNPEGKSEKWTVTTYYQAPKPKKTEDKKKKN